MLNKHLVPLLERRGYPVHGGRFSFVDKKDELTVPDLRTLSEILPIPRSWAYDKFGIPCPDDDEPVLEARQGPVFPPTSEPDGPDNDDEPPVRNADRRPLWRRLRDFFRIRPGTDRGWHNPHE